ncbi:TetR/AcrR family transcriptional regulator [Fictibacillus nanhaiensis]|uniref:TetR/AcrR family transcriptional regulator n=1 Tax=Fictibacillus nanhaiensis TaxID=742169 RepID=UPI002E24EAC1|nr:TetR/AcrR family transcriptional regulator [Fictibacillus nanhaiensis]
MKKGELRKQELQEKMSIHILTNGLQSVSLRNLAKAVGTSDRMLLHYYQDKEELMTEVLTQISDNLITILEQARTVAIPFNQLVPHLYQLIKDPVVKPYIQLWLELIARASKNEEPYFSIAKQIGDSFINYCSELIQADEEEKEKLAPLTFIIIEGIAMLDAIDFESNIEKALDGLSGFQK